jgi:hypothetical protein
MNTYHQILQFADEVSKMHQELQQLRTSDAALRAERDKMLSLVGNEKQKALAAYYQAAEEARSYVLGGPPVEVQKRLILAREAVQNLLEES